MKRLPIALTACALMTTPALADHTWFGIDFKAQKCEISNTSPQKMYDDAARVGSASGYTVEKIRRQRHNETNRPGGHPWTNVPVLAIEVALRPKMLAEVRPGVRGFIGWPAVRAIQPRCPPAPIGASPRSAATDAPAAAPHAPGRRASP
jgi:hypothetical protein